MTATFRDRAAVERAIDDLQEAGIKGSDLSVVMTQDTQRRYFSGESDVHGAGVAKGAAGGAAVGGSLGAIAGGFLMGGALTAATGGLAAPFLVAGPVVGALAGGGAGAAVGSIVGALVGAGVKEPQARAIEGDVKAGGVALVAHVSPQHEATAQSIMRRDGGGVEPGSLQTAAAQRMPTVRSENVAPEDTFETERPQTGAYTGEVRSDRVD